MGGRGEGLRASIPALQKRIGVRNASRIIRCCFVLGNIMKYYQHHIGDYIKATRHLSPLEDGLYRRLLDQYYSSEAPLPLGLPEVSRLVGAKTAAQKKATESVLNEFFEKNQFGWNNRRADAEILKFRDKSEKAKASATYKWKAMRSHSEGIADAVHPHSDGNANHKPITNNQEKKVVGADAPEYAFVGKGLKLTYGDFDRWKKAYSAIPDLAAELEAADAYYHQNPPADGKLYFPVSNWLKREHAKLVKQAKEERDDRNRIY